LHTDIEGKFLSFNDFSLYRLEITMETNPYKYDTTKSSVPQQNQISIRGSNTTQINQQQLPQTHQSLIQHNMGQKPKAPEKMPKARTLALANTLKRWLAVASIVGFGTISGLVAFHQIGTTTSQSTQSSSGSSSQNSNNFLNQQGGNTSGTSSSSTNSSSTSSSSSTPVTGTSTS